MAVGKLRGPERRSLGEVIAAAYDEAAAGSADAREVSRLAALKVVRLLLRTRNLAAARGLWDDERTAG